MKDGDLDMVIGRRELGGSEGELIRRERVSWVAAEHYRLRAADPVALALLPVGCGIRSLALATLDKIGRPWLRAWRCRA